MSYDHFFSAALARLHDERRYRVFADLERIADRFPHAYWHNQGVKRDVVIWCSNDYLGMGQHPKVVGAMVAIAASFETKPEVNTSADSLRCRSASERSSSTNGRVVPEMLRVPPAPAPSLAAVSCMAPMTFSCWPMPR